MLGHARAPRGEGYPTTAQRIFHRTCTRVGRCNMNMGFRAFCVVLLAIAVPSIVFAQSNTAFDGTYAGVSNTPTGGVSGCDPFNAMPRPLTVRDGVAQYWGGSLDLFEGDVSPQGNFKMSDMFANIIIGKIDPSGKATGSASVGASGCAFTAVWQRQ